MIVLTDNELKELQVALRAAALEEALNALRALHPPLGGYDTRVGDCIIAVKALRYVGVTAGVTALAAPPKESP